MKYDNNEFKRTRSWAWRNKGIKQKPGPVRVLWQQRTGGVNLTFDPNFHTGCWVKKPGERHRITLGGKFVDGLTKAAQGNVAHVRAAYQSLVRHEAWHGFATTRVEDVVKELRAEGIPFRLFNIFEDARIEHLARTCTDGRDDAGKFRWANWEEYPEVITSAIQWFGLLTFREASSFKSLTAAERGREWLGAKTVTSIGTGSHHHGRDTKRVIRGFYTRAINCRETIDLLPVIKDWCKLFGIDHPKRLAIPGTINGETESGEPGEGEGEGEGSGVGAGSGKGTGGELPPAEELANKKHNGLSATELRDLKEFQHGNYVNNWDEPKVKRIVNRLTQITASAAIDLDELGTTGSRLHLGSVIAGDDRFTRRVTEVSGRRTVTVLIDCSSSMNSTWTSHGGLEFVIALARLHRRGILDVRCWLSSGTVNNKGHVDRRYGAGCLKLPLHRITDEQIAKITPCHGSEGFAGTIQTARHDIDASSVTIAWTDGCITDGDVDARALRRRGVDIIGCAPRDASETKIRANILRHFGKGFLGEAERLARHIAHYVLNRD